MPIFKTFTFLYYNLRFTVFIFNVLFQKKKIISVALKLSLIFLNIILIVDYYKGIGKLIVNTYC